MSWKLIDVQAKPQPTSSSYSVRGGWQFAQSDSIRLHNGTAFKFSVKHAPCNLVGVTNIAKGANGYCDHASGPWTKRLASCLSFLQLEGTAVAVIDAPPPEHTYEALDALEKHKDTIARYRGTNKLLLICGPDELKLPLFANHQMVYSKTQWSTIRAHFSMFVETLHVVSREDALQTPLALLLGSHQMVAEPNIVHMSYPPHCTVPPETFSSIEFSSNVKAPSISKSRGITCQATSTKVVTARLIVQCTAADDEPEHDVMKLVRQSFSDNPAEMGAAYFLLLRVHKSSKYYNIAQCAKYRIDSLRAIKVPAPPPMARMASYSLMAE